MNRPGIELCMFVILDKVRLLSVFLTYNFFALLSEDFHLRAKHLFFFLNNRARGKVFK